MARGQALSREDRLQKLLASECFGGAPVTAAAGSDAPVAASRPATTEGRRAAARPASAPKRMPSSVRCASPSTIARRCSGGDVATSGTASRAASHRAPARPASARPAATRKPNVHTLSDCHHGAGSGSRLHQTTEAYRQQRGTTARTVEEVGRATMTPEKAADVDRARAKVHGTNSTCGGSAPACKSPDGGVSRRPPRVPSAARSGRRVAA
eukprot:TRINITY_DN7964_c0_g1_i1.p2 TRINITY_DN7964_c0_g1~~TRINITY_DN7964_c0_g1_i1.p2  ORF type:complete len:227 (-),score=24.34 TRINITY_DN7964_c0_g1_i1:420-1052(-)